MKRRFGTIVISLVLGLILGGIGGLLYANKVCEVPREAYFEIDGYFTNIQKAELSFFDNEAYYFSYSTGASAAEVEDALSHPENYEAFTVDLVVTSHSSHQTCAVWVVLPGYQAGYRHIEPRQGFVDENRIVWIDRWLSTGATAFVPGKTYQYKVYIIIKTTGMEEMEVHDFLKNMQINLQIGVSENSLTSSILHPGKNISFVAPILYEER